MVIVLNKTEARIFSVVPGITGRLLFSGENMMLILVELDEGDVISVHSHPHEQMGMCLRGEAEFLSNGVKTLVKAGMFYHISRNEKHSVKPLGKGGAVFLDIFSPPREDYLVRVEGEQ